jgi:NADH-quinone oxidoreductase subunit H
MPFHVALIAAGIKILVTVGYIMLIVPMLVWLERKLIADFQARVGPSRVGPFGLLQSFADGIKLLTKEALQPSEVDKVLYLAAPVIVMIPALAVAAVVPFGAPVKIGQHTHPLVIADLPIGFLFILALTSLSVYGIVLSGWASNNKYSLLGGLRSAAQMVSYELPMGLFVVVGLLIATGMLPFKPGAGTDVFSLSLSRVVDSQDGGFWNWAAFNWRFGFLGFIAMLGFFICGLAETNRAPFDLPEAESELIGGYHTEYGGMKWAMFFLGEYAAMLNVAAVTTTLFLGGWRAPYPDNLFLAPGSIAHALQGVFWFGLKIFLIIVVYIHLRASLPRLRYDRLMAFTWKALLPTALLLVVVIATGLTVLAKEPVPTVLTQSTTPTTATPQSGAPQTAPFPQGMQPPFGLGPGNAPAPGGGSPLGSPLPALPGGAGNAPTNAPAPANAPAPR